MDLLRTTVYPLGEFLHLNRRMRAVLGVLCCVLSALGTTTAARSAPDGPGEKSTAHLRVAWYPSRAVLSPTRPASLVVEVSPKPGMRVYAPGQLGYIPVSLALEPSPRLTMGTPKLPQPVEHVFPPTGERSLVFDRPFRLEVPVSLATGDARSGSGAGEAVVQGTFEYQACDDAVCYRPVKVPMSWTFKVERKKK